MQLHISIKRLQKPRFEADQRVKPSVFLLVALIFLIKTDFCNLLDDYRN